MKTKLAVTELYQTFGSSPSEWVGRTACNHQVQIHYRDGRLTIRKGPRGDHRYEAAEKRGEVIYKKQLGEDWDSEIKFDELQKALRGVISLPDKESRKPGRFLV